MAAELDKKIVETFERIRILELQMKTNYVNFQITRMSDEVDSQSQSLLIASSQEIPGTPYILKCTYCDKTYKQKKRLQTHLEAVHKEEEIDWSDSDNFSPLKSSTAENAVEDNTNKSPNNKKLKLKPALKKTDDRKRGRSEWMEENEHRPCHFIYGSCAKK